jgi:hypothetical protein
MLFSILFWIYNIVDIFFPVHSTATGSGSGSTPRRRYRRFLLTVGHVEPQLYVIDRFKRAILSRSLQALFTLEKKANELY